MTTLVALMGLNGALIAVAVLAVALIANRQRPSGFVYGASFALTIAGFVLASAFLVSRAAPETLCCRSACRGSARISASTRCLRSSSR